MITSRQIYDIIIDVLIAATITIVLGTVFFISNDLGNSIVSGKYFWLYTSMALLSVVAIPITIIKRRERLNLILPDLLILLFCCAVVLITLHHIDRLINKCLLLIFVTLFYFYLRIFLTGKSKLMYNLCVLAFVITGLIEAIWGLMQLYGFAESQHNLFRTTGSFFNPGPYSGWLSMIFPMALGYVVFNHKVAKVAQSWLIAYSNRRRFTTILCSLTVLCIILILPAAMSRASWIAVFGGCAFIGIMYFIQSKKITVYLKKYRKRLFIFGFMAIVLLSLSLIGLFLLKKDSASGRAFIWKIAMQTIKEHPFGVGLGNFGGSYGDVQATYFASGAGSEREEYVAGGVEYAFNEYLQICIETGIVPFLFFIAFVIYVLITGIQNKNYLPTSSLISLLIFASMSYPFNVLPFVIAFVFLSAMCLTNNDDNHEKSGIRNHYPKFMIWFFIIITPVAIALCMYQKIYPLYKAYKQWNSTTILYSANIYKEATEEYSEQYQYLQDEIRFLFEYAQSLSKSEQYEKSNEILHRAIKISCDPMLYNIMGKNYQSLKQYELAEQSFKKAVNLVPNRLYPHYLLAKLYYEMGLKDKAEYEINIVMTKPPKVESMAVEEMREELGKLRYKNKSLER
jgi:tetratricopeptide (TPR) repeat protein